LQNHKEKIILFLQQSYIDILLISETHFTTKNYFRIPRQKLYYTNHPDGTAHGGTAILIQETIEHYELLQYEKESFQATYIQVNGFPYAIIIMTVYSPLRHNLKQDHFATFFQILGPKFIAGGDYDSMCKHTLWGSRLITTNGRKLSKVMQEHNYSFLSTGTPTYWSTDGNKIPDLLDFFVTNGIFSTCTNIQSSYDLTSDHSPIIAKLSMSVIVRKPTPRLHNSQTGIPADV
jgi:exonuclease III